MKKPIEIVIPNLLPKSNNFSRFKWQLISLIKIMIAMKVRDMIAWLCAFLRLLEKFIP
jgi:hypothetical protein